MNHIPGEPDASKGACPVREGVVGNVKRGQTLVQVEPRFCSEASKEAPVSFFTKVPATTGQNTAHNAGEGSKVTRQRAGYLVRPDEALPSKPKSSVALILTPMGTGD